MTIGKACVIGAGVMGSGIAAQIANAGVPVPLLDIVPKDGADRSAIAKGAIERLQKTDPALLDVEAPRRNSSPPAISRYLTSEAMPIGFAARPTPDLSASPTAALKSSFQHPPRHPTPNDNAGTPSSSPTFKLPLSLSRISRIRPKAVAFCDRCPANSACKHRAPG